MDDPRTVTPSPKAAGPRAPSPEADPSPAAAGPETPSPEAAGPGTSSPGADTPSPAMSRAMGGAPRPPRHRVAPNARIYWLVSRVFVLVVVLAATLVPALLWEAGRTWLGWAAVALTVLLLPGVVLAPWLRYRTHRWEVTPTAAYSRTGWLGREWRIAPLSRVQTVEAKRNVLHRMLGLSAVSVTTASAQGAVVIQGLQAQVAEELVTQLTDAVARTRGDAT